MDWSEIVNWGSVGQIIVAITGCTTLTALLTPVTKFIGGLFADWLSLKRKAKFDKDVESHKGNVEHKVYISKVRFDAEFAIYRELSAAFYNMVNNVYFVYPTMSSVPVDEETRKKYEQEVFEKASSSVFDANRLINANAPFIPKDFYERFMEIRTLCKQNLDVYAYRWNKGYIGNWDNSKDKFEAERKAYDRTQEFVEKFDALTDDIRNYLTKIDVNS